MNNQINKKKYIFLLLIIIILIVAIIYADKLFKLNSNVKNAISTECSNLSFQNSQLFHSKNFGTFKISIEIKNQRKWKKSLLLNLIHSNKDGSFTNRKEVGAKLYIKKNNVECYLDTKIRAYGDQADHYLDINKGNRFIYELPSLRVKILKGHIYGVTDFLLLRPETRIGNNEIFITTLFNNVGLLSPRTTLVNVNFNEKKFQFLFQEKINKEFLEKNKLVEGPIFKGDERFLFKYRLDKVSTISKHKLENKNWANKNINNQYVAKEGLEILNLINFFYSSKHNKLILVDYFTSTSATFFEKYFKELPTFDSMMYSVGAVHGLDVDNRRFYYDSLNETYKPIYYNGSGTILLNENDFTSLNSVYKRENFKDVLNSASVGSSNAIRLIEDIDVKKFQKDLSKRGVDFQYSELLKTIDAIKEKLILLNNLEDKNLVKSNNKFQNNLVNDDIFKENLSIKYLFSNNNNEKDFLLCTIIINECENLELSQRDLTKALAQELIINNYNIVYFSRINYLLNIEDLRKLIFIKNKTKKNIIKVDESLEIAINGKVSHQIDYSRKEIKFYRYDSLSNIVFNKSKIYNWKIIFYDKSKKADNFVSRDKRNLSGCVNFYDSYVQDIEIFSYGSNCEDAINFVNSKGNINKVVIFNSHHDAIDFDYSNFNIKELRVYKSGNDCIDLSYGNYDISKVDVYECGDKAISVGEASLVKIDHFNSDISKNSIVAKDFSLLNINKAKIINTETCVSAYSKKQEFYGASIFINNLLCNNYKTKKYEQNGSSIKIKQ